MINLIDSNDAYYRRNENGKAYDGNESMVHRPEYRGTMDSKETSYIQVGTVGLLL